MRAITLAALALVASSIALGCSCGAAHEVEGSDAGHDAFVAADAGLDAFVAPGERSFTLELAASLDVVNERCAVSEGDTAMFRVTARYGSSCDTPGPLDVTIDSAARTLTITAHAWREHGRADCADVASSVQRDVPVVGLTAGAWTLRAGTTASTFTVGGPSTTLCPGPGLGTIAAGGTCDADCACAPGLSCLAVRGDAACARSCADPCEDAGAALLSLTCPSGSACTSDPNLGWTCATSSVDACDETHPCPLGMTCPPVSEGPRSCAWSITLNAAVRHACTTESDCDPGLDCVQRVDGLRACEVRCTTSDMACPSTTPHACMPGEWICEWLGE